MCVAVLHQVLLRAFAVTIELLQRCANGCWLQIAMKNFCLLDMIIVDGDPQLMPWLPESENLLQLM